jgi:predicted permease
VLPGVSAAAYITGLPMVMRGGIWGVTVPGEPEGPRTDSQNASLRYVTPGYFATLGIPIRQGRDVNEGDIAQRPYVAVVSESFVRRYWPGQDPLGRRFKFALNDREVVGVAADIRVRGFEQKSEPQVYLPAGQVADNSIIGYIPKDLIVRSSIEPSALVPAIRDVVRRADPELPISDVRTMGDVVDTQTASRAVQSRVIGAFALVAAILAAVGIHGMLALAVAQRSREFGVRIALGAEPRDILRMVLRQSVRLAVAGVVPGIALAYAAARALEGLLAGVKPADPATFLAVLTLSLVMTVAGSLVPTLRAVRLDPVQAIRSE